jgi:hypothetical protein
LGVKKYNEQYRLRPMQFDEVKSIWRVCSQLGWNAITEQRKFLNGETTQKRYLLWFSNVGYALA